MTETPKERVSRDLRAAMKAGEKERLSTLRMLLAEVNNEEIRGGKPVDEPLFQTVVKRAIKQRKEAAGEFRKGARPELAAKEEREAETLAAFLPRQASEEEIRAAVAAIVTEKGLAGPAAIGVVMKETLARFGGAADGGTVNRIARELLSAG
jgi:uncharacterized protein YqeY